MRNLSNRVIGIVNLVALILLIPTIGVGLWMTKKSEGIACEESIQTVFLVIGMIILMVSLCGFVGSCLNLGWAVWLYSVSVILLIFLLLPFTVFVVVVTSNESGESYSYSKWLKKRMDDPVYWGTTTKTCLVSSGKCRTSQYFLTDKHLSPIQWGCCKRPSMCGGGDLTGTVGEGDCYKWSELPELLCYNCESCKGAVLEETRLVLHTLSVIVFILLVVLIVLYVISCHALKNVRRSQSDYAYDQNRFTLVRPRWDYFWYKLSFFRF